MKQRLDFYDLRKKKKFFSTNYKLLRKKTKKGVRYFAITKSPNGTESWRVVSEQFFKKNK